MNRKNSHTRGVILRTIVSVVFWTCLVVIFPAYLSADDGSSHAKQLIAAYIKAVRADDPGFIKSSWTALNNDEEALTYMRITMPRLDYLFRIRGLYIQIQEIQSSRPEFLGGQNPSSALRGSVKTLKEDLSFQAVEEVAKFSLSEPDKTIRRTNGDIVADARGKPLMDNREIAIGNPNQNRIDNKEYVRNRADRMFAQKFQASPGEQVPRGGFFSKTRSAY